MRIRDDGFYQYADAATWYSVPAAHAWQKGYIMSGRPDLEFRQLDDSERELAFELAAVGAPDVAGTESFWTEDGGGFAPPGNVWGLFIRDSLTGAAWLLAPPGGQVVVTALALPRKRWGMGLATWILRQFATMHPDREIRVEIASASPRLGEALLEAGFNGPDPEANTFPTGTWLWSAESEADRSGGQDELP